MLIETHLKRLILLQELIYLLLAIYVVYFHYDASAALTIVSFAILRIHRSTFAILFTWLISLALMSVEFINQEIHQSLIPTSQGNLSILIKKWKENYGCIYKFIQEINRSFGHCLATFSANQFIVIAFVPYLLYFEGEHDISTRIQTAWRIISNLICFLLIIYSTNILRNKVRLQTIRKT